MADDAQVVGVDAAIAGKLQLALQQMIRDTIEPEPTIKMRVDEIGGCSVLIVEVFASGRWHVLKNDGRSEFYVRRGASTFRHGSAKSRRASADPVLQPLSGRPREHKSQTRGLGRVDDPVIRRAGGRWPP